MSTHHTLDIETIELKIDSVTLTGDLLIPHDARGLVIFAHGSGSSRLSTRNRFVSTVLNDANLATLLFDLLTPDEEQAERFTRHLRFDIPMLADRVVGTIDWLAGYSHTANLHLGLFGASTGAAAALVAAAQRAQFIHAVVSRGGRPDLADDALPWVHAPTLLIVGGEDPQVIHLNRQAADRLTAINQMQIIPGATHLFEEPGTLEQAADLARDWFSEYLA